MFNINCKVVNHLPLKLPGTEHRVASAYRPQTNGLTERFNQTQIQVVNEKRNDWDDHIKKVMFSYRYVAFCICIINMLLTGHPFMLLLAIPHFL